MFLEKLDTLTMQWTSGCRWSQHLSPTVTLSKPPRYRVEKLQKNNVSFQTSTRNYIMVFHWCHSWWTTRVIVIMVTPARTSLPSSRPKWSHVVVASLWQSSIKGLTTGRSTMISTISMLVVWFLTQREMRCQWTIVGDLFAELMLTSNFRIQIKWFSHFRCKAWLLLMFPMNVLVFKVWSKYFPKNKNNSEDLPLYDDMSGDSWAPCEIPDEPSLVFSKKEFCFLKWQDDVFGFCSQLLGLLGQEFLTLTILSQHLNGSEEKYDVNDNDCILLVKHLVNSESLSQKPMTLLPVAFASRLTSPLEALPRNLLSDRAKKESFFSMWVRLFSCDYCFQAPRVHMYKPYHQE